LGKESALGGVADANREKPPARASQRNQRRDVFGIFHVLSMGASSRKW
jgi:hypothetical protein